MKILVVGCAMLSLLAGLPGRAAAQCTKDTDCEAGKVCRDGQCVLAPAMPGPLPATPEGGPVQPSPSSLGSRPSSGWPIASAVMAFAFTGVVVGLGVASGLATADGDKWGGIGLGAGALGTLLVFGPVCSTGQSVARSGTPVWGGLGARIPAWILYGITAIEGAAMLGLGLADVDVPEELIYAATAWAGASLILFGVDDLVSLSQAQSWYDSPSRLTLEPPPDDGSRLSFAPAVAPLLGRVGQESGVTLGIVGSF